MCNTHLHPSITYDLYLRLAVAMVVFRGGESSDLTATLLSGLDQGIYNLGTALLFRTLRL